MQQIYDLSDSSGFIATFAFHFFLPHSQFYMTSQIEGVRSTSQSSLILTNIKS